MKIRIVFLNSLLLIVGLIFQSCSTLNSPDNNPNITVSRFAITDNGLAGTQGNEDGLPNKKESVRMNIELFNSGKAADGVTAELSTTDNFVSIDANSKSASFGTVDSASYKDIADDVSSSQSYIAYVNDACFLFSIKDSCPADHRVLFTANIADRMGDHWTDTFSVAILKTGANIVFSNFGLYDGTNWGDYNTVGNGNNLANPGETLRMNVELRNAGTSKALGINCILSTIDQYVTVSTSNNSVYYGDMLIGKYKDIYGATWNMFYTTSSLHPTNPSASWYLITISNNAPANHICQFKLSISDTQGNSWQDSLNLTINP